MTITETINLVDYIPTELRSLDDPQSDIPRIAKDDKLVKAIEAAVKSIPTRHYVHCGDSRTFDIALPESIHLVLTSPPYWLLQRAFIG